MAFSAAVRQGGFVLALLIAAVLPATAGAVIAVDERDQARPLDAGAAGGGGDRVRIGAGEWIATGLPRDDVAAAREYLRRNAEDLGLSVAAVDRLELVNDGRLAGSDAHAVLFTQRFGGLPAVGGGMVAVGVDDGRVASVASSLSPSSGLVGEPRLGARAAWHAAAAGVGLDVADRRLDRDGRAAGFAVLDARPLDAEQQVRPAALPVPDGPARAVYEVNVVDTGPEPAAYTVYVDAETGEALRRVSRLDHAADQPNWQYFQSSPPLDGADTDTRVIGCFPAGASPAAPCTIDERSTAAAAPAPWDVIGGASMPSTTTNGNNADTALSQLSPLTPSGAVVRPTSPTREYRSPYTDAWRNSTCSPSVFAGGIVPATGPNTFGGTEANDVNAAIISLFANHNHMHDWSYNLGFTEANYNMQVDNFDKGGPEAEEGDPEIGNAQAGSTTGGSPTYTGRDNANQITLQDGIAPITNMYLWQPIAAAFYPPCVDGDFDMSVIGHEYTHAISNRMVGGPDNGLTSSADGQARAMGESFSDLTAVEFLHEYGLSPAGDADPFAVGAYVTGSNEKGIRNYNMGDSPLNYSNVQGYDGSGNGSPHDDGEIWSAVNFDIREALIDKYGAGDAAVQLACADGQTAVSSCPGNRRWMQLVFDSYLLMPPDGEVSMLEARDALLAADMLRFGGDNQAELWDAFARRGFGSGASSTNPGDEGDIGGDTDDPQPVASFSSPLRSDEATLTFKPTADQTGVAVEAELYVGDYEANVTPVADTDPATPLDDQVSLLPGTYSFVARGDGFGGQKISHSVGAGQALDLNLAMPTNRASNSSGAVTTDGDPDGVNPDSLTDDTEVTNWAAIDRDPDAAGADVIVDLAGGEQLVDRVNVSALLRDPDQDGDDQDDPGSQNRFTALRQFELQACVGATADCDEPSEFASFYTSSADAFPGDVPRPLAPDMNLRSFDVPDTQATHVRFVVVTNQCLGKPLFMDNTLDNDPASNSDCRLGNPPLIAPADGTVRAAELQVFSSAVSSSLTPTEVPEGPGGDGDGGGPDQGPGPCGAVQNGSKAADKLAGTSASDLLRGRGGRDRLDGRGGDDCLRGGRDRDRLRGGAGDDLLAGGRGPDRIKGGGGADLVRAARGRADRIDCGPGKDRAVIGRGDRTRRCERIKK